GVLLLCATGGEGSTGGELEERPADLSRRRRGRGGRGGRARTDGARGGGRAGIWCAVPQQRVETTAGRDALEESQDAALALNAAHRGWGGGSGGRRRGSGRNRGA